MNCNNNFSTDIDDFFDFLIQKYEVSEVWANGTVLNFRNSVPDLQCYQINTFNNFNLIKFFELAEITFGPLVLRFLQMFISSSPSGRLFLNSQFLIYQNNPAS